MFPRSSSVIFMLFSKMLDFWIDEFFHSADFLYIGAYLYFSFDISDTYDFSLYVFHAYWKQRRQVAEQVYHILFIPFLALPSFNFFNIIIVTVDIIASENNVLIHNISSSSTMQVRN